MAHLNSPHTFRPPVPQVLAAKPKKGNAVLFHSIKPNGELERLSLHTAWCARGEGRKGPSWGGGTASVCDRGGATGLACIAHCLARWLRGRWEQGQQR